jgi:glutamate synthase (NADPH/NADH) large chain
MGTDTPLAVLSDRPQLLFKYFKQLFAQVTNPPIDPIREELVMSLTTSIGPKPNLMDEHPESARRIRVKQPILTNADLHKIREIADPHFKSKTLKMLFRVAEGPEGLGAAVDDLCKQASQAIREGYKFLILSDRGVNAEWAPIPSLLGVAAVHHHLVRECTRTEVGLTVETGEPRDVHHFACLIGFGAGTVNPYLVFESLVDLERDGYFPEGLDAATAEGKFIKAINKGLGAQIFEAIGLNRESRSTEYFTGTPSAASAASASTRSRRRWPNGTAPPTRAAPPSAPTASSSSAASTSGAARARCTLFNPETVYKLQHSDPCGPLRRVQGVHEAGRRPVEQARRPCAACSRSVKACETRCRSTRSSPWPTSSGASRPAP